MNDISKRTLKRMLKEAGAERISDDAAETFHRNMNRMAFGIAARSVKLAKHAKRKTVRASDVKLAIVN